MKKQYICPLLHIKNGLLQSTVLAGSNNGIQEYIPIGNGGGKEPGAKKRTLDYDFEDDNEEDCLTKCYHSY